MTVMYFVLTILILVVCVYPTRPLPQGLDLRVIIALLAQRVLFFQTIRFDEKDRNFRASV